MTRGLDAWMGRNREKRRWQERGKNEKREGREW
jgi:hypothetical protein